MSAVMLWLQNSHAVPIPAGADCARSHGCRAAGRVGPRSRTVRHRRVDVADFLPDVRWPEQIEFRAGRHVVRPRYEVIRGGPHPHRACQCRARQSAPGSRHHRTAAAAWPRLSAALPDPAARRASAASCSRRRWRRRRHTLPLRLDVFDAGGKQGGGTLPRLPAPRPRPGVDRNRRRGTGHAELVYDFRDGGEADGWLHALFRYEDRQSGHVAESSFGAHIFNTAMTYRDEPQSYTGPPPGLRTTAVP